MGKGIYFEGFPDDGLWLIEDGAVREDTGVVD